MRLLEKLFKSEKNIEKQFKKTPLNVSVREKNIIQLISDWIKNPEPIEVFGKLLNQIDVKFPIKLKDLVDGYHNTFTCETGDDKIIYITLIFGDGWDRCYEMHVECDGKIYCYSYFFNNINLHLESITLVKNDVKI